MTKTYTVEFWDKYQGTRTIDVEADSLEIANEIVIRFLGRIPTGVYLKN
jgi:hypothetical protein